MTEYCTLYNFFQKLDSSDSRKYKEDLLAQVAHDTELQTIFWLTYNPDLNYYVKSERVCKTLNDWHGREKFSFEGCGVRYKNDEAFVIMVELLKALDRRKFTGNKAIKECCRFLYMASYEMNVLFKCVLDRDLDCGVGVATINKIWPNLIPKFKCMLASAGEPKFPVFAEEKFDGVRVVAILDEGSIKFFTRNGKELDLPIFKKHFEKQCVQNVVFDGEITSTNRTKCSGIVTKIMHGNATTEEQESLQYNVFDVIPLTLWQDKDEDPFKERMEMLDWVFPMEGPIHRVESILMFSPEEVNEFYEDIVARGGEGVILKDPDHCYEWKRSKSWIKMKEINTIDLRVIKVLEGHGKRSGGVGSLLCETDCGTLSVRVGSGLTDSDVEEFNKEPPIGKIVEVKYNTIIENKTTAGEKVSLFLPRFVRIRSDKDETNVIRK